MGRIWQGISFARWRSGYITAMSDAIAALRENMEERIPLLPDGDGS